ncbi:MAG TPA: tRNA pseudouridine(55) synthase TruB [Longimicrobiaceae bacterium]|nr:tRNA pseudouridine(55) synthase TruB [Longimicrobiaceae bacterium]
MNGVLAVDKPAGPTSHDAVAAVRRALRTRQVGHTGTLDPFASGLLLVCIGAATRLAEYLTGLPKTYLATVRLGQATDTDDLTGAVVSSSDAWREVTRADVEAALARQVGTIQQLPPLYSAKKVDGERMYAAARRGAAVDRRPSQVTVHAIRVLGFDPPDVEIEVECGAGTYIRAIARDAGEALGVGGHLRSLRRTRIGGHEVRDAVPLDALGDEERVGSALLSPLDAVAHLPRVAVDGDGIAALRHGRAVPAADAPEGVPVALVSADGELLAIGERSGGVLQPRKVFSVAE